MLLAFNIFLALLVMKISANLLCLVLGLYIVFSAGHKIYSLVRPAFSFIPFMQKTQDIGAEIYQHAGSPIETERLIDQIEHAYQDYRHAQ